MSSCRPRALPRRALPLPRRRRPRQRRTPRRRRCRDDLLLISSVPGAVASCRDAPEVAAPWCVRLFVGNTRRAHRGTLSAPRLAPRRVPSSVVNGSRRRCGSGSSSHDERAREGSRFWAAHGEGRRPNGDGPGRANARLCTGDRRAASREGSRALISSDRNGGDDEQSPCSSTGSNNNARTETRGIHHTTAG